MYVMYACVLGLNKNLITSFHFLQVVAGTLYRVTLTMAMTKCEKGSDHKKLEDCELEDPSGEVSIITQVLQTLIS